MQVTFNARGTPDQVRAAIQQQSKAARAAHGPHAAPAISSVRDYIAAELQWVGAEANVAVSVTLEVQIVAVARLDGKPMVRDADGLIHGDDVVGVVESTFGDVPIGEGIQLGGGQADGGGMPPVARTKK